MANLLGTIVSDLAKAGNAVKSFFEKTAAAAQVVEDAGEAAGANALNVTLDTQTVSDLKTVIAAAKAASLPSSPAPAPIAKSA
jgi:cobalamin biosynthesis protein CobD/CbiB